MKISRKILKWFFIPAGTLILLVILVLCAATLYLTPERLQSIITKEAGTYLEADVTVDNPQFTIWSSFPHFRLTTDSIRIVSKTLKGIDPELRRSLPSGCDSLASARSFAGGINIISAIAGKFELYDVNVDGLSLNLVAVNDSLNNFNIIPAELSSAPQVPYITANRIRMTNPGNLSYFSLATNTNVKAQLKEIDLTRTSKRLNEYNLRIPGNVSMHVGDLKLLAGFPFTFDGKVRLGFKPFAINLFDYAINLGNTKGRLNLNMAIGNTLQINNFSFRLAPFNVPDLLSYFPDMPIAQLHEFAANLEVDASARLVGSYNLSSESLPSMIVDFNIPPGDVTLALDNGSILNLNHSRFHASLDFNGRKPNLTTLSLDSLRLSIPGATAALKAEISDLMTAPIVNANVSADANLADALRPFFNGSHTSMNGILDIASKISFSLPNFSLQALNQGLRNVEWIGDAKIIDFKFKDSTNGLNLSSDNSEVRFSTLVPNLNLNNPDLSMCNTPVSFLFNSDRISLKAPNNSLKLDAANLNLKGTAECANFNQSLSGLSTALTLNSGRISLSTPETSVNLSGVDLSSGLKRAIPATNTKYTFDNSPVSEIDERTLQRAPHTPEYLIPTLSRKFKKIINTLDISGNLKVNQASVVAKAYPVKNQISNLNLDFSFDSIAIRSLDFKSQKNRMKLNGSVSNLRRFLSSPTPQLLPVTLNVALDTVNINKLARAYESGVALRKGVPATFNDAESQVSAMDTTAFLIPRNIQASINASIMETVYMNLHLYDLATNVRIKDGIASVNDLSISSDFGKAKLNLDYNSRDIQKLGVGARLSIYDINIVNFFKNFHTLLLMMPQMKNLSGILSADVNGNIAFFPNMYANVPSLKADIALHGHKLTVHQNKFIHHIAEMMAIRTHDDIHIKDLNVNASVHDNLIELYPFYFDFDRYKLQMLGTNNFNGKLYYHIAVLESPVPFKFGINIVDYFHDPSLRFGGPTFKINKGEEVTSSVMENNTFNVVRELKKYLKEFIQKAAESDNSDNSEYAYPVPDYRTARKLHKNQK